MARDVEANEPRTFDRFGILLAVVVTAIVAMALIDARTSFTGAALINAISGAALLVAVRAAGVPRRWRWAADALVLITVLGNLVYGVLDATGVITARPGEGPAIAWVIAALLVPVVVARRLLHHNVVSLATVLGAVVA